MMDLDDVDRAYVASLIPEGAIPVALVTVVSWIDTDDGDTRWKVHSDVDAPVSTALGLLELAKLHLVALADCGLPIQYDQPDDNDG